jgi:hypothetical protein
VSFERLKKKRDRDMNMNGSFGGRASNDPTLRETVTGHLGF